jgi:guanosine-3',5'-bis(diphosphate) 3'-pyrophosphohydrolase
MIERAFAVAEEAHRGQTRKSGEPYVLHPVAVATIVARQGLDDVTVAAALLHDAVEDTALDLEQLEKEFGSEVMAIVDGVTKLDRVKYDSKEMQHRARPSGVDHQIGGSPAQSRNDCGDARVQTGTNRSRNP